PRPRAGLPRGGVGVMRGRILAQLVLAALAAGCGSMTAQEYLSGDGRYRAEFVGTPKIQEKHIPVKGMVIIAHFAISEEWSGTGRMVMYADYPGALIQLGNKEAALDGACQGMLTEAHLTQLGRTTISMNGHPGREVSFESQSGWTGPKLRGRARL